ncbi:hypothetical protein HKA89_10180 [Vibrio parahaemolyticus]|uniref:hypothetical protein n=1 Tax=Vibrio parahaemolyticus TaxID=670 RepID=UPI00146A9954|nr:hypothetical protein [Vibrio parahaemolyticus]NMU69142.1 hypothetical protein [Vibrio parahaemolyticus]
MQSLTTKVMITNLVIQNLTLMTKAMMNNLVNQALIQMMMQTAMILKVSQKLTASQIR